MASGSLDLADVKALLSSGNPVIQSIGLSRLLSRLRLPFPNAKEKVLASTVFFDGFIKYGDIVTQWCAEAAPCLIDAGIISSEEINAQCFVKLCNNEASRTSRIILIRLLLKLSPCWSSTCFEALRRCKQFSDILISELLSQDFDKCFPALRILLFSGILPQEQNISILHHICVTANPGDFDVGQILEYLPWKVSHHLPTKFKSRHWVAGILSHCSDISQNVLLSLELSVEDVFLIADNLLSHPQLVMNELFPASHVLLPSLFSLYSSRSELAKSFPALIPIEQLTRIKSVIANCQRVSPLKDVLLEDNSLGFMSTFTYLQCVSEPSNITSFVLLWLSNLDVLEVSSSSVTFSTALIPYLGTFPERCFDLVLEQLKHSPEHVNSIFLFLSSLYARPFFKADRATILHFMRGLLLHKFVVTPAVNFLSIVCNQAGEERNIAFSLMEDLVTRFPTTFDALRNLVIPGESDSLDLLKGKLRVLSAVCVSTDRYDELLPLLSSLLKKKAEVVGAAVPVVITLCKEEILDINTVRKQLSSVVRQPGFELALTGYCEILAAAPAQSGQYDDSILVEYVKELWEITQFRDDGSEGENARRQAWIALGCFDFNLLKSVVPISGRYFIDKFLVISKVEREGLALFLRKLVSVEVESISRSLYTKINTRKTLLAPLVFNLHHSLGKTNQEAPWFWLATLPLFSVIVNEYSEGGMKMQAFKLFRRLLREVPLVENKLVNLFAGWRICISTFLTIETDGQDIIRCRDRIVEECKRSLKESELAVNNVVVVIAVLAGEMKRGGTEKLSWQSAADFEISMRPWVISALEFLFPLVFHDYKQRSHPLLLIHVNPRCVSLPLARSAVCMICSLISNEVRSFYEGVDLSSTLKWRLGMEVMQDEDLYNLLLGGDFDADVSLSRSAIWLLGTALGAEELVINSLSCSIPSDNAAEESLALFCGENDIETDDITTFFSHISNVTLNEFRKHEKRLKKQLEKFSANTGEELKRMIYEGLSHLASVSLLSKSADLPATYSHLPDNSILRTVVDLFCTKSVCTREVIHDLLPVLVDHIRSDGRHLPPLDLQFILSAIDYRNNDEARLNMLLFAIQQEDRQVIYELTDSSYLDYSAHVSPYLLTISRNLPLVLSIVPGARAVMIVERLLKFAIRSEAVGKVGKQILEDIDTCGQQQVVLDALVSHVPLFNSSTDLLHPSTSLKSIDKRFKGRVSGCFDFWLECSGRIESELSDLVGIYVEESVKSNVMLSIFGYCSMSFPLKTRLDKLVDLMSIGKVMLSNAEQKAARKVNSLLELFLALLCSTPADIPLHWLSSDIKGLLLARWRYYWKKLASICEFCELFDIIVAFLSPCLLMDCLSSPMANVVKGMMLYILSSRPEVVRAHMEDKIEKWDKLLT